MIVSPRGIGGAFPGTSDPTGNVVHETQRFLEACPIARSLVLALARPMRALLYQWCPLRKVRPCPQCRLLLRRLPAMRMRVQRPAQGEHGVLTLNTHSFHASACSRTASTNSNCEIFGTTARGGGPQRVTPTSRTMYQLISQSFPAALKWNGSPGLTSESFELRRISAVRRPSSASISVSRVTSTVQV
jgi:hypothetical protein